MVALMEGVTPRIARCAHFIDVVLCSWIHNPVVSSTVIIVGALGFLALQMMVVSSLLLVHMSFEDYALDFVHNIINLLFVLRFPAEASKGLSITSSTWAEVLLLAVQNVGCAALLLWPEYLLLHLNMHPILKALMLWQIACPYLIFMLSMAEAYWNKLHENNSEKHTLLPAKFLTGSLLVDTNNNLLPIFMGHSFAAVNFNFSFAPAWVIMIYKLACFLLKFYLINRYVLYELVVVISDMTTLKKYSELYMPVIIGERRKSLYDTISSHMTTLLTTMCVVLMGIDAGFMAISLMR